MFRVGILAAALALLGAGPETITYESPVFTGGGENYRPKETLTRGEKNYRLVSTKIRQAKKEGELTYVSSSVPYTLEGREEPPETAVIRGKDTDTGAEFDAEVPLLETVEKERYWSPDFSFPVTVSGYGAEKFYLGDTEIPADADLSAYGSQLLDFLGLPEDCYRVDMVSWSGEPYEQDGNLLRDAEARGEKLIRSVEARYGGQTRTPDMMGKQFIGIYEEIVPETEEETATEPETEEPTEQQTTAAPPRPAAVALEERKSFGEALLKWLEEHWTVVTFSGFFFLAAGGVCFLLWRAGKKPGD